jgi:hypothetical protein
MNEQQMTTLVERTGDTLSPDVQALVAGGVARGRARRRHRTLGSGLAGMAAVGAVAALGYVLVPGDNPIGTDTSSVATAPATAERRFGMDPAQTGSVLASLLDGQVTHVRAGSDDPDEYLSGSVLLNGALVGIVIERTTLPPACGEPSASVTCDVVPGGVVTGGTHEEPASEGGSTGIVASTATYFTSDGLAITATAWNASGEKGVDPLSARPVLTEKQVAELVQDPVWLDEQQ